MFPKLCFHVVDNVLSLRSRNNWRLAKILKIKSCGLEAFDDTIQWYANIIPCLAKIFYIFFFYPVSSWAWNKNVCMMKCMHGRMTDASRLSTAGNPKSDYFLWKKPQTIRFSLLYTTIMPVFFHYSHKMITLKYILISTCGVVTCGHLLLDQNILKMEAKRLGSMFFLFQCWIVIDTPNNPPFGYFSWVVSVKFCVKLLTWVVEASDGAVKGGVVLVLLLSSNMNKLNQCFFFQSGILSGYRVNPTTLQYLLTIIWTGKSSSIPHFFLSSPSSQYFCSSLSTGLCFCSTTRALYPPLHHILLFMYISVFCICTNNIGIQMHSPQLQNNC